MGPFKLHFHHTQKKVFSQQITTFSDGIVFYKMLPKAYEKIKHFMLQPKSKNVNLASHVRHVIRTFVCFGGKQLYQNFRHI